MVNRLESDCVDLGCWFGGVEVDLSADKIFNVEFVTEVRPVVVAFVVVVSQSKYMILLFRECLGCVTWRTQLWEVISSLDSPG